MRKGSTRVLILGVATIALLWWGSQAIAYHDQGVAHCNGCHTMHNSEDGAFVDPENPFGNAYLLRDATPSDICLECHATRLGAVFGDDPLAPPTERGGGNFVFLLEDNLNDAHAGASNPISGDAAGHNIISAAKGTFQDATLMTSPGGTFPSSVLACSSCHDPHGNGNFRLLYSAGVTKAGVTFLYDAPTAVGLSLFGAGESNSNHTAYQGGVSGFCGNCHGDFHNEADGRLIHPSGSAIGGAIAEAYNLYNGSEDANGGTQATAYLAAVPFQDPGAATNSTAGPSAASQVMCLTCHRAHASSAADAGRWDFNVTFLHEDGEESGSYQIPDPYGSLNQRSLCNKCHVKDGDDALLF